MSTILDEYFDEGNTKPRAKRDLEKFTKVPNRLFTQGRYLTLQAKWVYTVLKSFENNKTKRVFPSYDKIMERSGLSRPDVAKALRELEKFCWIKKKRNFSKSNDYSVSSPTRHYQDGSLADDQTCPTSDEAFDWLNRIRYERKQKEEKWNVEPERWKKFTKQSRPSDGNLPDEIENDSGDIPF